MNRISRALLPIIVLTLIAADRPSAPEPAPSDDPADVKVIQAV